MCISFINCVMKYLLLFLFMMNCFLAKTQSTQYPFRQMYLLDSIGHSNSIAKHWAGTHFRLIQFAEEQFGTFDSNTQKLIRRFEAVYTQFFIDACNSYYLHQQIRMDWQPYFSDSNFQPIQYKLLAVNADLNGELWQALCNSFTFQEMNMLKEEFKIFKKSLSKIYRIVSDEAATQTKRIALLQILSLGSIKSIGNIYMFKWRSRQMKLALLYLSGSPDFAPLLAKVNRNRAKINSLIFKLK